MSSTAMYFAAAAAIFGIGLYGAIAATSLVRKVIGLNITGSSVFLVLIAAGARPVGGPDPVPHAMVLTGIVVTVAVTGLAVALIRRLQAESGRAELPEDRERGA